jgi:hypothetical protein
LSVSQKPGDIEFIRRKSPKPALLYPHPSSGLPLWALLALLVGLFVAPLVYVVVWGAIDDLQNPPSVPQPSANDLSIPARPGYPGYYATFYVKQHHIDPPSNGKKARDDEQLTTSLTFSYEHLKVIVVADEQAIPASVRREANTFRQRAPRDEVEFASVGNQFDATLLNGLSVPSQERPVLQNEAQGQLRPYIIYGDVDVLCGQLVNNDAGFASAHIEQERIKLLQIELDGRGPRGPPSTQFMVELGPRKLTRTVYIVGRVESFSGPDQFHRSFMAMSVIDLGPSSHQIEDFQSLDRSWREKMSALASTYQVKIDLLNAFAGEEVDVYDGNVSRTPSPEEQWEFDQKRREDEEKEQEQQDIEQQEREADRPEIP